LDDILKLISQAWLGPEKAVLIHVPTFPRYELEANFVGAKRVFVESQTPWQIDISAIENTLNQHAIDVAYLCTPNNPTGALISTADIERLASAHPNTTFVVDEALADPVEHGAMPFVNRYANIVVLRTFSKYFGLAGLRVGYAVGQPNTMASLTSVRPPFNVSGFSAKIAMAALENEAFLDASRSAFKEERSYVSSHLEAFPAITIRGSCSNMMIFSLTGVTASEFVDGLAGQGILVVDATSFRGLEDVPSIRISLRTRPENTKLIDAISNTLPRA
ncbi:MAG: histidinol-phosphate transaminase, partial [Pseudomonadota bacterium]